MNEEQIAEKLIKNNERTMCKFLDHVATGISIYNTPELANCDFEKLQKIMLDHYYKIDRVSTLSKKLQKDCKEPENYFLVHRSTIKL